MSKKTTIYLAALANTGFGLSPATVPLQLGYVKAYATSVFKEDIAVEIFITCETLFAAIARREPDILGCSWYGWNQHLTVDALAYVKKKYPRIVTVVGGACAPETAESCRRDLAAYPGIELIIPNEGEIPFANVVRAYMAGGREQVFAEEIAGALYADRRDADRIIGAPLPPGTDLTRFPSPYLNGDLDEFLGMDLMPIVQTSRGCPYNCSYCVSGRSSWKKLRLFDTPRISREIEYIEQRAHCRELRITDENFGIHARDLEIAQLLAARRKATGYPQALRMYTDKHVNDRIKQVTLLLRDLIPMNISCQTLTPAVQKNIGRNNVSVDKFKEAVIWAHLHNLNITTEAIFGLPGETAESFMGVVNTFVQLRLDSVVIGTLQMLKETEISSDRTKREFGYQTLYGVAERGYTQCDDFASVEIDAWAVANNSFTMDEYLQMREFIFIFNFFLTRGFFKEMVYLWDNRGIKLGDVISEILARPQTFPFIADKIRRFRECIRGSLFATPREVHDDYIRKHAAGKQGGQHIGYRNHYILSCILEGELVHEARQDTVIGEISTAAATIFGKTGRGSREEFDREMEFAGRLVRQIIVPFWRPDAPPERLPFTSEYDLLRWRQGDYQGALTEFALPGPKTYGLRIASPGQYAQFVREHAAEPYDLQSEAYFRIFRTNNIRRYMEEI